jgi:cell division transport system permease protein
MDCSKKKKKNQITMGQEDKRLKRRVRNSYLISTVSIAMVLFLLGSTTYLILNALNATNRLRESVVIHVMLKDGLSVEQTSAMRASIELQDVVREVTYVPKEEAAQKFIAETGEDFTTFLGDDPDVNPLPDSFEVGLAARGSEREIIEAFVAEMEATNGVDEVVYQRGVVEKIGTNLSKFNLALMFFGGALLVISLILLNNTIRMTIIAKRRIISTMKLVGANSGFIMRPFAASAVGHGLLAGVIASVLFALLVFGMQEGIPEITFLKGNMLMAAIAGGMIVLGVVISLLFTMLSVSKAVRQESAKALI